MAISLRRALCSYRNVSLLLRPSLHSRHLSHFATYTILRNSAPSQSVPNSPAINFFFESRRGFAKGRKQKDDDVDNDDYDAGNTFDIVNFGPSVKATALSQMDAAIEALSRELSKLRTGRASAGILDHILIETSGVKMPLSRVAVVSVLDSKTLSVTPYDPNAVKELEKAIVSSPLGLNPKVDGQRLIAAIPPLTKEHKQAVCKVVAKSAEDVKQSIRRSRQKAFDTIKKFKPKKTEPKGKGNADKLALDVANKLEKEVDELTKKFIKSAEDMCKAKEKEISES